MYIKEHNDIDSQSCVIHEPSKRMSGHTAKSYYWNTRLSVYENDEPHTAKLFDLFKNDMIKGCVEFECSSHLLDNDLPLVDVTFHRVPRGIRGLRNRQTQTILNECLHFVDTDCFDTYTDVLKNVTDNFMSTSQLIVTLSEIANFFTFAKVYEYLQFKSKHRVSNIDCAQVFDNGIPCGFKLFFVVLL
jgi:hypothetical protein